MSNPFYPPGQSHAQPAFFDPHRPRHDTDNPQQDEYYYHGRSGTEGPASAALFYSQDAPVEGDMTQIGTGTDGFGAGESSDSTMRPLPPYAQQDYRHEVSQRGLGDPKDSQRRQVRPQEYQYENGLQPSYQTPAYDESPQPRTLLLAPEGSRRQQEQFDYADSQTHQYPPRQAISLSPQPQFMGGHIDRPDTPGYYPDRAPKMEKLNMSQKKVVKQFPVDLDEENGSLLKTTVAMIKDWRSWLKWKYIPYYVILIVIVLLVAFLTVYHRQIVDWLTPISQKVRSVSWGWIIPVVILFVISFPPLFGHEIVGVLLGIVYGLWIGFGILSLGTLLGEWGNFYAFKYLLRKHAEKYERRSLNYACMAYIVREGGFIVVLLARLSAIPGHFTTAVFATVGMGFFVFTLATLLSMPKQLLVVYLGVVIEQSGNGNEPTSSKIIKYAVVLASTLVTIFVAVYLYARMQKARPLVQAKLRDRRYQMLSEAALSGDGFMATASSDESVVGPDESTTKLYGQSNMYSTDDLESSQVEQKGTKGESRWKWGRKNKAGKTADNSTDGSSMAVLEKGNGNSSRGIVLQDGTRLSHEDTTRGLWSAKPYGQGQPNLRYASEQQQQQQGDWQQQQQQQQQQRYQHHQQAHPAFEQAQQDHAQFYGGYHNNGNE